jgi:hypothetical protein
MIIFKKLRQMIEINGNYYSRNAVLCDINKREKVKSNTFSNDNF